MAQLKLADLRQIAEEFSTSTAYSVGDYCVYQGLLYRFTAAHSGAWSAADVVQTDVGEELTDLKQDLSELDETVNGGETSIAYVFNGVGYIYEDANHTPITNYNVPATGNNQLMVINDLSEYGLAVGDRLQITVGWATGFVYAVGFNDQTILPGGATAMNVGGVYFTSQDSVQTLEFTIPEGTVAMIIFNRKPSLAVPTIIKKSGDSIVGSIATMRADVDNLQSDVDNLKSDVHEVAYRNCVRKPFVFSGKSIQFFGDSITYGYIAASGDVPAHQATNQYPKVFADGVGATYTNNGVSGAVLVENHGDYYSIFTRIKSTTLNADYVFVAGGVNDWQAGVTEAELITGVTNICEYLEQNYTGEVIWITPINEAGRIPAVTPTQTLQNVRNVITRIALQYGHSVVQGWEFPFPVENDDADYISLMLQDKLHPTELGYTMYAQALRNAVC